MTQFKGHGRRFDHLSADTPAVDAARDVLQTRMDLVAELLPLAASLGEKDEAYVHQLRVSSRRAVAGLEAFKSLLNDERMLKVRKRLKKIRRIAGTARECDVQSADLKKAIKHIRGDAIVAVEGILSDMAMQRRHAQKSIAKVAQKFPRGRIRTMARKVINDLNSNDKPRAQLALIDIARLRIPRLIAQVRDTSSCDLHVLDNLHNLRIRGKQLRYSLELFSVCLDNDQQTLATSLEKLQNQLGNINDSHEMLIRLRAHAAALENQDRKSAMSNDSMQLDAVRRGTAMIVDYYEGQLRDDIESFHEKWATKQWRALLDRCVQRDAPEIHVERQSESPAPSGAAQ